MNESDPQPLEDLNLRIIRAKNDEVDDRLTGLENEVSDLESEVSEKEETIESLKEEKQTVETLLSKFRDGQKQECLDRIRKANEAVDEDEEVDLSAYDEASVDVLEAVATQVEKLAEKAGESTVSNRGEGPDLSNVDPDDVVDNGETDLKEAAEKHGLGSMYERVLEKGDVRGPISTETDSKSPSASDFMDELQKLGGDN